ncbi:DNA-methyltransferase [Avibacterium paragallinarum]|uniref:Methyltransferase n=1 Tax=Avibacterium paragallinarum TaxID=728 RepID=A0AAE5TJC3_AVIPA|nr:site-specific DNA-methyltransferase [Avibacterium paragallinarum]MEE3607560.1 site-specific DNA-methyltransferase [Avibacterium paragallinarum]MEE3620064.1 site-specific DNA-methyltransferase [Avibacterium paragallinarum]MEE3667748.1 site-specific DNA-methyltransferase [Avibacterium paragallinarum]MEE3679976.1 site-specific DNA-methyltransferase [Avibacterium paragallinarum]MEE4384881.1 site-specific DNA-methyltransferase [Avibacterium paragallinarum]
MNNVILQQGNCLELIKDLADNSVDMILTDPPYYVGMTSNGQKATFTELSMLKPFFEQLMSEWRRVLKPDGVLYCFTDWRTYPFLAPILAKNIELKNLLIWDKAGRISPHYGFYHELIIFAGNNQRKICKKNILKAPSFAANAKKTNGEKLHNAQKPIELLQELICDGSDENDLVLDCFMGSGSTGVACRNTQRRFIGFELDPYYFEVSQKRLGLL